MKKLIMILAVLLLLVAGFYAWLGGFSPVKISEQKVGPYELLYLQHTGPYNKVYPVIMEVEKLVKENNVKYESTFGIFYDKPGIVADEKLRSIAGVIVSKENATSAEKLIKEKKLMHRTIKEQNFAKAEFPFKNLLSIYIAIYKVYPAFNQYSADHRFPDMEYKEKGYENNYILENYKKDTIEYLMTLPKK